jgi:hypothetical protein
VSTPVFLGNGSNSCRLFSFHRHILTGRRLSHNSLHRYWTLNYSWSSAVQRCAVPSLSGSMGILHCLAVIGAFRLYSNSSSICDRWFFLMSGTHLWPMTISITAVFMFMGDFPDEREPVCNLLVQFAVTHRPNPAEVMITLTHLWLGSLSVASYDSVG